MYIILGTMIVLIIYLFGTTIFSILKTYSSTGNPSFRTGNLWFISLLIINITIILFLYIFYNYKLQTVGKQGSTGNKGNTGLQGDECIITFPNTNNNYEC